MQAIHSLLNPRIHSQAEREELKERLEKMEKELERAEEEKRRVEISGEESLEKSKAAYSAEISELKSRVGSLEAHEKDLEHTNVELREVDSVFPPLTTTLSHLPSNFPSPLGLTTGKNKSNRRPQVSRPDF